MATKALLVIEARFPNQRLMRIVTRNAGKPSIFRPLPTAALLQPVRLKTNAADTTRTRTQLDIHACPVTRSTEIYRSGSCEMGWIEDGLACVFGLVPFGCVDVLDARSVARFTVDSRNGLFKIKRTSG
jgi:hypothetical protein